MKKIISFSCIFFLTIQLLVAQDSLKTENQAKSKAMKTHDFYLQKSKTLIPVGAVLLGAGIGATIGGVVGTFQHYDLFSGEGSGYLVLWITGIACVSTGIPILIKGFVYHSRANLILRDESLYRSYHLPIKVNVLSVGVAIPL
ncbi:MAG: hypothetical protein JST47_12675 [Bacteroidetes bacterium]|nr:hypothetical protein [Bacteroidota bacterium]